jgi:hypothetical protein
MKISTNISAVQLLWRLLACYRTERSRLKSNENNVIYDRPDSGSDLIVPRKHRSYSETSLLAWRVHVPASCNGNPCATHELKPHVTGVIPRIIRGGDPLHMLNPFAPAKYGTAEEDAVVDSDVPGRGDGIKLLSASF